MSLVDPDGDCCAAIALAGQRIELAGAAPTAVADDDLRSANLPIDHCIVSLCIREDESLARVPDPPRHKCCAGRHATPLLPPSWEHSSIGSWRLLGQQREKRQPEGE